MVSTYIPSTYSTADRLIQQAMENAGVLPQGQDPSSEALMKALHRLNDILNATQVRGLRLWKLLDQSVTLVAGTATYTLGSGGTVDIDRPLEIMSAYYLDSSSITRPILPLSWDEYTRLSDKTASGEVVNYFVSKGLTSVSVSFYQVPDATAALGTAHLLVKQTVTQVSELDTTIDLPREWYLAVTWMLAAELCTGQADSIVVRCEQKAKYYHDMADESDLENTPVRFVADFGESYGQSSFR